MKKLTLPLALSLILALTYFILKMSGSGWLSQAGFKYLLTGLLASLSVLMVRIISFILLDVVFKKRKGREAPALLRVIISIIVYSGLFALIYTLLWQRDLSGLMATSAVVTVILGLALQDTLGNFFAGLSLHVEQPYYIGDAIRLGDMLGRVEAVTWRTTTIRTNNNTTIIFPNSKVARDPLEVYPLNSLNRRIMRFPAPYSIPPERVIMLAQETIHAMTNVAVERTPVARVADFSESSITYELLYWVKDYMLVQDIDSKIKERIWYAYHRNEIEIPFPTRHLLIQRHEAAQVSRSKDYERVVEKIELFEPLSEYEREDLCKALVKYVYAPGEVILRRGDAGESMFVIHRGKVEVRLPGANGSLQPVAVLEPGNFFGEMALFTGEPRTADVSAVDEVEILEIRKAAIEHLFNQNAALAEAFSHKIAERQAGLARYSVSASEVDQRIQTESILLRIKRFFSLD